MDVHEADGVFQGGGVKGIALVGALLGFAERGYTRWVNVAGASAGAIIAAYLACGHDARDAERLLRRAPYRRFEDFGAGGKLLGGTWNLLSRHGLARGDYFRRWFNEELEGKTFAAVKDGKQSRLKLIAADVTNRDLLVLPDDLPLYRLPGTVEPIDPDRFLIADAVRMSMSIPFFFRPVELVRHATGKTSTIVDGGMLSNFPVWLFDVADQDPVRPTFGFRLTGGRGFGGGLRGLVEGLGWPVKLGSDMFQTAMEAWDKRFMSHSTRVRTCPISAEGIGTVDFNLSQDDQTKLLESGKRAGREFLAHFNVDDYFNTYGKKLAPAPVHA
jgi:NTE family protein